MFMWMQPLTNNLIISFLFKMFFSHQKKLIYLEYKFIATGFGKKGSSSSRICLIALRFQLFIAFTERKKKVPFSMAIGNGELMHECFFKHLRMRTARMK